MSPEQARGEPIDWRSDIFAAGVMLFELTTGKRLFKGTSEYETLKLICDRDYPLPVAGAPRLPARARGHRDARARRRTARSAGRARARCRPRSRSSCAASGSPSSTIALSQFMQGLFEDKLASQKEALLQGKQLADIIALESGGGLVEQHRLARTGELHGHRGADADEGARAAPERRDDRRRCGGSGPRACRRHAVVDGAAKDPAGACGQEPGRTCSRVGSALGISGSRRVARGGAPRRERSTGCRGPCPSARAQGAPRREARRAAGARRAAAGRRRKREAQRGSARRLVQRDDRRSRARTDAPRRRRSRGGDAHGDVHARGRTPDDGDREGRGRGDGALLVHRAAGAAVAVRLPRASSASGGRASRPRSRGARAGFARRRRDPRGAANRARPPRERSRRSSDDELLVLGRPLLDVRLHEELPAALEQARHLIEEGVLHHEPLRVPLLPPRIGEVEEHAPHRGVGHDPRKRVAQRPRRRRGPAGRGPAWPGGHRRWPPTCDGSRAPRAPLAARRRRARRGTSRGPDRSRAPPSRRPRGSGGRRGRPRAGGGHRRRGGPSRRGRPIARSCAQRMVRAQGFE